MVPAALRRLGTLGLIALWVLVSGGLLLLLALSVQNSMQFSRLQAWILLANVIALIAVSVLLARKIIELVRAFRARRSGFAPHGAHGGHLRLAGHRAADHRLSILARVPEPRHRQLVQGRDQAGPHRRARALQVGDGRAHARIRAQHASCSRTASPTARRRTGPRPPTRSASKAARSKSWCTARSARCWPRAAPAPTSTNLPRASAEVTRAIAARQPLLEPGAAVGRRLPDQHGGAYRDRARVRAKVASWWRSTRCRRSSRACRKPCSTRIRSTTTSRSSARA